MGGVVECGNWYLPRPLATTATSPQHTMEQYQCSRTGEERERREKDMRGYKKSGGEVRGRGRLLLEIEPLRLGRGNTCYNWIVHTTATRHEKNPPRAWSQRYNSDRVVIRTKVTHTVDKAISPMLHER